MIFLLYFILLIRKISTKPVIRLINHSNRLIPYQQAYEYQLELLNNQLALQDSLQNSQSIQPYAGYLYILQHTPVYTLGTTLGDTDLPLRVDAVDTNLQFDIYRSDRAGEATFHGPGQIVFYPILDLNYFEKDINLYLRGLEEIIIESLKFYGISAGRIQGLTGVWVGNSKVAAMGIKLRRWITLHGFSVNINVDMRYFNQIIACGILDKQVGSVVQFQPHVSLQQMTDTLIENFATKFAVDFVQEEIESITVE